MKRAIAFILTTAALLAAVFTVSGCFGEPEEIPEVELEDLLGKWKCEADNGVTTVYSFTENMRYTKQESATGDGGVFSSGDFTLDGNVITLKPFESLSPSSKHEISVFENDRMVWGRGSITSEYIREK